MAENHNCVQQDREDRTVVVNISVFLGGDSKTQEAEQHRLESNAEDVSSLLKLLSEFGAEKTTQKRKRKQWTLTKDKYLDKREERCLRKRTERLKEQEDIRRTVHDWMVVQLGLDTGLRVSEMTNLKCSNFFSKNGDFYVYVECGKGGEPREVLCNTRFKEKVKWFLEYKKSIGEAANVNEPFFPNARTGNFLTPRSLQQSFKRSLKAARLSKEYGIHSLRHTYALNLYEVSKHDLRFVQRQLGHKKITTTQIYLGVRSKKARKSVEALEN